MSISIFIVDDHAMFAESLAENLTNKDEFEILKIFTKAKDLIDKLNFFIPQIILMDYNMPEIDGLEASKIILKKFPNVKILIITMHSDSSISNPLIKIGIKGIVLKNTSTSELINAINALINGKTYFSQEIITNLTKNLINDIQFTKREKEIITLLRDGNSTKDIAEKLSLSPHTIESHRKNLLAKTQTKNTQSLLKVIEDKGIL